MDTCIVLAKEPLAGRVKTRLSPGFTPDQAAELAAAALRDTLSAVEQVPARRRLLAFDGPTAAWAPAGWRTTRQPAGGLDVRLAAAFEAAGAGNAVLVGMDTPQLHASQLAAFDPARFDACLGLARDGGYWTLGLRDIRLAGAAIIGVPMSCSDTGARQRERLVALGLRVQLLDELVDVDTPADAYDVAERAPHTGFARALSRLRPGIAQDAG
ncbi:DUF2064 domain-containing protein [uncultured Jatrophihabitans sp.]|uniref:TIGR04282 family arsenosugar biosynthesis glycosyltransferase n=1 Tax=uncultured Jatrophihabitans sp. TaxID=1610747 RepID=UPI0035CADB8A